MHLYRGTPYRIFIKVKKIVYVKCRGQICCSINEYSKWVKWVEFLSSVNLQRYQVRGCMHAHSVASNSLQPIDCSPPGSSVHGTFQARVLEWAIIFYCRGPYNQGIELAFLESPALAVGFFFFFLPLLHLRSLKVPRLSLIFVLYFQQKNRIVHLLKAE